MALSKHSHPYIPNSVQETKQEMMRSISINKIEELFADVPQKYHLKKPLNLPKALSEFEIKKHIENLLSKNKTSSDMPTFLGAGCWPHYVPAVVRDIVQRSEFLTSYTPYQSEISQGILQVLFEYQSMICELTNMEVSNCSLYDWASALGEAARMASRLTRRKEILIPKIIHPERLATLQVYCEPVGMTVKQIEYDKSTGQLDLEDLKKAISDETAAIYIENPSYMGFVETQAEEISREAHINDALFLVGVDPISLGILKPPGDYGADVVIGEAQPLGNYMNFGGPLIGIFACRNDLRLIRQMPGRIIGMTTTRDSDKQCFCMALQTREQHIRREKATSNMCTNEAMCAVASTVYLALLGPHGLQELGRTIISKASYTIRLLSEIDGIIAPVFRSPHFKEFTVSFRETDLTVKDIHDSLLQLGIHGGKDISKEFPEIGNTALYCVTEIHSEEEIKSLATSLKQILTERG